MDDTLRYVVHQLDGRGDIIALPRTFLKGLSMSADRFEEVFSEFKERHNNVMAYEKAEELHERLFGSPRYSDYDSFRVTMSRKKHDSDS